MGQSKCFTPVRGRMMRATRLDGCGRPVYGDENVATTDGFVSVAITGNTEDSEAITVTNASGRNCVQEPAVSRFSNYTANITFCNVDPALFSMLTAQEMITDENDVAVGFSVNSEVDVLTAAFALEVWTGVPNTGACEEGDQGSFGYLLLPFLQGGTFGDFTIENGAVTFSVSGIQTKVGSTWGTGPYDVDMVSGSPSPLLRPIKTADHLRVQAVALAPPEPYCGLRPLLDPDGEAITDFTATVAGMEVTFEPVPAGTDPMWYDFGDGTWDYTETGSYVHTYDAAGDYEVTAYRGNSSVTKTVTV